MNKITAILGSIRFWQVVVVAVVTYLGSQGVVSSDIVTLVSTILGASVVIGTVDSAASRFGGK